MERRPNHEMFKHVRERRRGREREEEGEGGGSPCHAAAAAVPACLSVCLVGWGLKGVAHVACLWEGRGMVLPSCPSLRQESLPSPPPSPSFLVPQAGKAAKCMGAGMATMSNGIEEELWQQAGHTNAKTEGRRKVVGN